MPTGAMNMPLCFSPLSMKIVNTSSAERNISMNRPWMMGVPPPKYVRTVNKPGKRAERMAAAAMLPRIWVMVRNNLRT
jgi:hypothetical protein